MRAVADDGLWVPPGSRPIQPIASGRPDSSGFDKQVEAALTRGRSLGPAEDPTVREMRLNRQAAANAARPMGGSISFATQRPRDPMWYWEQNNLPYRIDNEAELSKIRRYCNTPEAPVWMGDYSFKPIGEIVAGDEVMGWTYTESGRRRMVRTKVLATQRRTAPMVVKITMESGRVIRCTPDHQWANPQFSPNHKGGKGGWKEPEYRQATVGRSLVSIIEPTEPLADEKLRLAAAWLGGVYDGEGTAECIAQDEIHNPAVRERIKHSLDLLGIAWTENASAVYIRTAGGHGRGDSRQDFVDFLNWADPVRRTTTAIDAKMLRQPRGGRDRVVSIEEEGPGEVVSMQTGTGNYTAWGYASKNCRMLYWTHPLIASAIDIYSKYPLTGMEFSCKDPALTEFYSDLFLDQLDYEDFLVDLLRSYWIFGEAWPFGSFNETLGVWEDDELMNPDDIRVTRSAFMREPRFEMKLPETLRNILNKREPVWEYQKLIRAYPELQHYMGENAYMPVSNVLLQQIKFKGDLFHPRGIPILMRGMRAITQEEMLNAAQDAIADRLYTPLVLFKLGATASDLGTTAAWVPNEADIQEFERHLDAALAADFRVLTHHFAVEHELIFGKENMPDFGPDFERLGDRQLQVFGLSRTMLNGADGGQTYAADALNRDLVSQLLSGAQRLVKKFTRQRMLVVAEAQEHYDYEVRNGRRYPIMEEVLEVDEETGEQRIVEQPKLLVPDLKIKAMDLRREEELRTFIEGAVAAGVPISQKTRFVNIPIDLDEERDAVVDERVNNAIAEQETRKQTYQALKARGLPIPQDLIQDFEPRAQTAPGQEEARPATPHTPGAPLQTLDPNMQHPALQPTPMQIREEQQAQGLVPGSSGVDGPPGTRTLPRNQINQPGATRPPESDEQRRHMPVAAALQGWGQAEAVVFQTGEDGIEHPVVDEYGRPVIGRLTHGPSHVGMRRYAVVDPDFPLDPEPVEEDPAA